MHLLWKMYPKIIIKNNKFFGSISRHSMFAHTVWRKSDTFCDMYKKPKRCIMKCILEHRKFPFFRWAIIVFERIMCRYTRKYFLIFLNILKYVFRQFMHLHLRVKHGFPSLYFFWFVWLASSYLLSRTHLNYEIKLNKMLVHKKQTLNISHTSNHKNIPTHV
jgi:hypothetical protein